MIKKNKTQKIFKKCLAIFSLLLLSVLLSPKSYANSKLFVYTLDATNITQTTATLNGTGGFDANYPEGCSSLTGFSSITGTPCNTGAGNSVPAFPITAYFRYSTRPIAPIYCNDIYGTNMLATGDYRLNTLNSSVNRENFAQSVINLKPNTTYYYCAIVSNRDNIAYGGASIVKEFHTNCNDTTIETKSATNIRPTSARLNASFCSTKPVKTYFKYREVPSIADESSLWTETGKTSHVLGGKSNVYGNVSFNLSGLNPNKKYEFKAVAETSTENPESFSENFTTLPSPVAPLPTCPSPRVYDYSSKNCVMPPSQTCTFPQVYNPWTNNCVTPISCTLPEIYFPPVNRCVTRPVCSSSQFYNPQTNTCDNTPGRNSCENNPSDPWCNRGSGWEWDGNSWKRKTDQNTRGIETTGTGNLTLGQIATPPSDAIVRFHEGIETVFTRQIMANVGFATLYGYRTGSSLQTFAEDLAHSFAKMFGYIDETGREIRVSPPDVAAYQLRLSENNLTVYEYYYGKIVDIRNMAASFKSASGYEYYFKKTE